MNETQINEAWVRLAVAAVQWREALNNGTDAQLQSAEFNLELQVEAFENVGGYGPAGEEFAKAWKSR